MDKKELMKTWRKYRRISGERKRHLNRISDLFNELEDKTLDEDIDNSDVGDVAALHELVFGITNIARNYHTVLESNSDCFGRLDLEYVPLYHISDKLLSDFNKHLNKDPRKRQLQEDVLKRVRKRINTVTGLILSMKFLRDHILYNKISWTQYLILMLLYKKSMGKKTSSPRDYSKSKLMKKLFKLNALLEGKKGYEKIYVNKYYKEMKPLKGMGLVDWRTTTFKRKRSKRGYPEGRGREIIFIAKNGLSLLDEDLSYCRDIM